MKVKRQGVLGLALFLFLLPSLFAQDFNVEVSSASINTCRSTERVEVIRVENTGNIPYFFNVEAKGRAAGFARYVPNSFSLDSGKSQEIYQYITPALDSSGKYILDTAITTNTGLSKTIEQAINVNKCANYFLTLQSYTINPCPCSPALYEYTIQNSGAFTETYEISADDFDDYVAFSSKSITLGPGQKQRLDLGIRLPCGLYGVQKFNLVVKSKKLGITSKSPVVLNIRPCYDYTLSFGNFVKASGEAFKENAGAYNVCSTDNKLIPVLVSSQGTPNKYSFEIKGPEWAELTKKKLTLDANKQGFNFIELNPENVQGNYEIVFTSTTEYGKNTKANKITVSAAPCAGQAATPEKKSKLGMLEISLITLGILAALMLFMFFVLRSKRGEIISEAVEEEAKEEKITERKSAEKKIEEEPKKKAAESVVTVKKAREPIQWRKHMPWIIIITVIAVIAGIGIGIYKFLKSDIWFNVWKWLIWNQYYIYALAGLFVIILVIHSLYKRRKGKNPSKETKKDKPKKESRKEENKEAKVIERKQAEKKSDVKISKKFMRFFIALIIAGLLVAGLYAISYFKLNEPIKKYLGYAAPYINWALLAVFVLVVVWLFFSQRKGKKGKAEDEKAEKLEKEELREAKKESKKKIKLKKTFFSLWPLYLILILAAVAVLDRFGLLQQVKPYRTFIALGIGLILYFMLVVKRFSKGRAKKEAADEKEDDKIELFSDFKKDAKKRAGKKDSRKTFYAVLGLIVLSGLAATGYSIFKYGLWTPLMDFALVYKNYIFAGVGILVLAIILISRNGRKKGRKRKK